MDESHMTLSTKRSGKLRYTVVKLGVGLALAAMFGGIVSSPAFAGDRGRGGDRGGRGDYHGHWRHGYDRRDWRGNGYYEPAEVYAPPPVYYPPQPSPGVSLFFPVHIR
jgi:hypothetical protein